MRGGKVKGGVAREGGGAPKEKQGRKQWPTMLEIVTIVLAMPASQRKEGQTIA